MRRGWLSTAALFLFASASPAAPLADRVAYCEGCHGRGGNSEIAGTPSIAAQPAIFLENQLVFFRERLRKAQVMQDVAKEIKDEEITALARYFASQKARIVSPGKPDDALMERGARIAGARHCGQCHLPAFEGHDQMPRLAGQREDYLFATMIQYRDGKRTGADTTMTEVLYGMSDADIRTLAYFMARVE